jgi:tetratricopeptide (TPR) repeat protein
MYWFGVATKILDAALPEPEFEHWHSWERLMPHARSLIDKQRLESFPEEADDFLSKVAMYAYSRADFATAEAIYRQQVSRWSRKTSTPPTTLTSALSNLGSVLVANGRAAEARPLIEQALAIETQRPVADDFSVALSLTNLGCVLHTLEETSTAVAHLQRAIALLEGCSPDSHFLAASLTDLGGIFRDECRMEEAECLFRRALTIDENCLEATDPRVGMDLQNLADLLVDTGREKEGRPLQDRALQVLASSLPPNHPKLMWALSRARLLK